MPYYYPGWAAADACISPYRLPTMADITSLTDYLSTAEIDEWLMWHGDTYLWGLGFTQDNVNMNGTPNVGIYLYIGMEGNRYFRTEPGSRDTEIGSLQWWQLTVVRCVRDLS
jgi:hypothetical protein